MRGGRNSRDRKETFTLSVTEIAMRRFAGVDLLIVKLLHTAARRKEKNGEGLHEKLVTTRSSPRISFCSR
jgi:hypothetical protein